VPTGPRRGAILRWLLPVVLVVAAGSVGAGLLVRDLYGPPPSADGHQIVSPTGGVPSSVPRSAQPGDAVVRLSTDAAQHPDQQRVLAVLQQFFDAINQHSYDQWRTTVTIDRVKRTDQQKWLSDYETTTDGTIVVHRIDDASNSTLRILLSFVSTQDVSKAPPGLGDCIRWRVVYVLAWEHGDLRIDVSPESRTPQADPC
jgi:hypothetical protein